MIFLQNLAWGWSPRFSPSRQISSLWVKKCGSTAPKIGKIAIFWYKFAQNGYTPLSDFYEILFGEEVTGLHTCAKFHRCGFKNVGLQSPKSRKMAIFGIHLPLKENYGGPQKKLNIGTQLQTFLRAKIP